MMNLLTIFGGTFDPIHNGHLRLSLSVTDELELDEIFLMPAKVPPHRPAPDTSIEKRIEMLEIATKICPKLKIDLRELKREGPSYTIDTLKQMREELGNEQPIAIVIGMDSFLQFNKWHKWQEIIKLCHIIIAPRPNFSFEIDNKDINDLYNLHKTDNILDLKSSPAGSIYILKNAQKLEVSATQIRELFCQGKSAQFLIPDLIFDYILKNRLYS